MDIYDRLALGAHKYAELSHRQGSFYLRVLERPPRQAAIYLTHEIPLTQGQMESLADLPFPLERGMSERGKGPGDGGLRSCQTDLLLNLPGLQVRYMENSLAFIEDNTVLSWGPRQVMADMALKMLDQVHQPANAKAS